MLPYRTDNPRAIKILARTIQLSSPGQGDKEFGTLNTSERAKKGFRP